PPASPAVTRKRRCPRMAATAAPRRSATPASQVRDQEQRGSGPQRAPSPALRNRAGRGGGRRDWRRHRSSAVAAVSYLRPWNSGLLNASHASSLLNCLVIRSDLLR